MRRRRDGERHDHRAAAVARSLLRWLVAAALVALAAVVWILFGAQWVLAPLAGYVVYRVGTTMLRNMATDARALAPVEPQPVDPAGERTLYRCEQCGAEVLLLVRGTAAPPRHCGETMRERVEIPRA